MSSPVRTRRSTLSLWIVFFVNGAVLSAWAPRIPDVKRDLALSDGQLGWALLGIAAGSIPALVGTARLLRSLSSKALCISASIAFPAALPLLALAPNGGLLAAALAVLGAASGALDIAMNSAAIRYQDRCGARILSRLHGGYSLGVLAGAASGAVASMLDVTVLQHFIVVSGLLVTLAVGASVSLPPSPTDTALTDRLAHPPRRGPTLAIPLSIGAMAVAALLVEGMVSDWSALLVSRDFHGGPTIGALALVAFSCAMFVSRSIGDLIIDRLGAASTVRYAAGVVTAATVAGLLTQHQPWGAVVALGCIGFAVGPLFPLLITEAGRRSRRGVATATAHVSVVGYAAYLGGPPLVGFLADHIGLLRAFTGIGLASCTVLALAAVTVRRRTTRTGREGYPIEPETA
ncbi:MAG: MFS transporter [Rhodococcus sp. (in: high G+C Gram-positive bacteria)]|nr:MFS transporter [Rhodococcus sp. (in: high G+C Gram-positive bacteria)]